MKSDIHPNYHMIKVVMTNGVEFMTRSTYGEEGAKTPLPIARRQTGVLPNALRGEG